jgi:RNA polymerase sigma factor (sigma-70 family)
MTPGAGRELTADVPPDRHDEGDASHAFDTQDELLRALADLPPRQRTAIVLRYFLDLPEAEVASAMKCSLGTVKSTAARGLARLEQALRTTNDTRSIST